MCNVGNIRYWNDFRILADNTGAVRTFLRGLNQSIHVVLRMDGSGTTNIFTTALSSFDPAVTSPDYSFATRVGGSEKPTWCGPLTDEVQIITILGCTESVNKEVNLMIVGSDYKLRELTFSCDIDESSLISLWMSSNGNNKPVYIQKSVTSISTVFKIGYLASVDSSNKPRNWYQPYILSVGVGLNVTINTVQEGGNLNSHYNFNSKPVLPEIKSIWIDSSQNFTFNVSYNGMVSQVLYSQSVTSSSLKSAISLIDPSIISTITKTKFSGSSWVEYQILFVSKSLTWTSPTMSVNVDNNNSSFTSHVSVNTLTTSNNFPIFHSKTTGYLNSGVYTCYKREHNYSAFNYFTGQGNLGVVATVSH
jgi:PBP superfamily domain